MVRRPGPGARPGGRDRDQRQDHQHGFGPSSPERRGRGEARTRRLRCRRARSACPDGRSLTTPGPPTWQATLARLVERGCRFVAMETSSHSLDQGRLDGVVFAGALFTNLSREHLDYHRTMEAYRAAKLRLLDLLAPDGVVAVNRDDPAWAAISPGARVIGFGLGSEGELRARDLVLGAGGSRFVVDGRFGAREVSLPLPGAFNVANALGAAAVTLGMGLAFDRVMERLESAPQVAGRMERLVETPFVVLRDYAHKPDALERVLQSLRPLTAGRLTVVFGCGGDRRSRQAADRWGDRLGRRPDGGDPDNPAPRTPSGSLTVNTVAEWPDGAPLSGSLWIGARRSAGARPGGSLDTAAGGEKGNETYQIIGLREYLRSTSGPSCAPTWGSATDGRDRSRDPGGARGWRVIVELAFRAVDTIPGYLRARKPSWRSPASASTGTSSSRRRGPWATGAVVRKNAAEVPVSRSTGSTTRRGVRAFQRHAAAARSPVRWWRSRAPTARPRPRRWWRLPARGIGPTPPGRTPNNLVGAPLTILEAPADVEAPRSRPAPTSSARSPAVARSSSRRSP
ncbi:MAG: Mur ligase family protein [Gemmatimonadales bacterium]